MLAEWQDALDGDFSMSLAALQQVGLIQNTTGIARKYYSDPERLNTPCSRSGIDSAANIGSAGTADGVFEPGSHGRIDVAISDSISGDEQH